MSFRVLVAGALAAAGLFARQNVDRKALVKIARLGIESEVRKTQVPPFLNANTPAKGVFVTIEADGKILGCRGDLAPRAGSLELEVLTEARAAAAHDPRYKPLTPRQLAHYRVTITIVERLEPLPDFGSLQPGDGLVFESGDAKGVVLPWEGKDPRTRLIWARRKAGVPRDAHGRMFRLVGERFQG